MHGASFSLSVTPTPKGTAVSELITRGRKSKYFWPASAITPADMALVYKARESAQPRIPISELIARAIRHTYGQYAIEALPEETQTQTKRKAA